jgi:hypothetical protein
MNRENKINISLDIHEDIKLKFPVIIPRLPIHDKQKPVILPLLHEHREIKPVLYTEISEEQAVKKFIRISRHGIIFS